MSGKTSAIRFIRQDGTCEMVSGIHAYVRILSSGDLEGKLRYNEMTGRDEIDRSDDPDNPEWDTFGDNDLSRIRYYFDTEYGMNNRRDLDDALRVVFSGNTVDPVATYLRSLQWDGQPRVTSFLHDILKADNDEYTAECSRLIFAGGVHRAFKPGCKYDNMVVLVGGQGCGKSTIVRLLNVFDDWYKEVTTIDGKEGIEAISGSWVAEFSEMMAMTSIKEIEGVKAYITRQVDHVRKAYGRYESDLKRRCVFIGTTNNDRFLTDKTGNRRFYPVTVHSDGYEIGDRELEIRRYIVQCWAEAVALYDKGMMPPFACRELSRAFAARQEEAQEDDWRVGAIQEYLRLKKPGDYVCIAEIYETVLQQRDGQKADRRSSIDVSKIIYQLKEWERVGNHWFPGGLGTQKAYRKKAAQPIQVDNVPDDMPF